VSSVDQMKKIIIKRAKLEEWLDSFHFREMVKNAFVRISVNS